MVWGAGKLDLSFEYVMSEMLIRHLRGAATVLSAKPEFKEETCLGWK